LSISDLFKFDLATGISLLARCADTITSSAIYVFVFNDIIANIKGNDRKLKIQRGEASYVFFLSNEKKRNEFLELIGKKVKDTKNENKEDENIDYEKYDDFD
jgi:hypothetical protein